LGLEASFVCESVYFNFESSRKKHEFPTNKLLPQITKGFEKEITLNYIQMGTESCSKGTPTWLR
jgi:GDP-D-mannose dehydratase